MKRIAVLTSGGDAPGMNAAIRAVVEQGLHHGIEVWGVRFGYKGLVEGDFIPLSIADVHHKVKRGGTMLYTARYPEFREEATQLLAIEQLKKHEIDGLIVIGDTASVQNAV